MSLRLLGPGRQTCADVGRHASHRHDAAANRTANRVSSIHGAELSSNGGNVIFHRLIADAEPLGDRFVRSPFRQELQANRAVDHLNGW